MRTKKNDTNKDLRNLYLYVFRDERVSKETIRYKAYPVVTAINAYNEMTGIEILSRYDENGEYAKFAQLEISGYVNIPPDEWRESYQGFSHKFESVDLQYYYQAKQYADTLIKMNRTMTKIEYEEGGAITIGQYITLVARAMGITRVLTDKTDLTIQSFYHADLDFHSLSEIQILIDTDINKQESLIREEMKSKGVK